MTPKYSTHVPGKYRKRMSPDTDQYFRIDSGRYKGICFTFGDIRVEEQADGSAAKIRFDFDILVSPFKKVKRGPFTKCLAEILDKELMTRANDMNIEGIVIGDTPSLNFNTSPDEFREDEIIKE